MMCRLLGDGWFFYRTGVGARDDITSKKRKNIGIPIILYFFTSFVNINDQFSLCFPKIQKCNTAPCFLWHPYAEWIALHILFSLGCSGVVYVWGGWVDVWGGKRKMTMQILDGFSNGKAETRKNSDWGDLRRCLPSKWTPNIPGWAKFRRVGEVLTLMGKAGNAGT